MPFLPTPEGLVVLDDSGTLWNFLPSDPHNPIMPMIPSPLEYLISQGPYGGGAGYPVGWSPETGVIYHRDPNDSGYGYGVRPGPGGVTARQSVGVTSMPGGSDAPAMSSSTGGSLLGIAILAAAAYAIFS